MDGRLSPVGELTGQLNVSAALSGGLTAAAVMSGTLSASGGLSGKLTQDAQLQGLLTIPTAINVDAYDGPYEFTPTQEAQTVNIQYKTALQNITINPIPSNYGLVTWNGSIMTVS